MISVISLSSVSAAPVEKNPGSKAPGDHEGAEIDIKPAIPVPEKDKSESINPQAAAELPYLFSFNQVGTGRWSSDHFKTPYSSFSVTSKAFMPKDSPTQSKIYFIQAFRDTFFSSTALGTYAYHYGTLEDNARSEYGEWKAIGASEYNLEVYSDGPYVTGSGTIE
ncbi:hypothetical protein IAQ67_14710 [Paenibacillus peoriae]|uniref:Uncharacterized protein n=1 Tax=Paenibacillus peoriae TaxID=59893 RepID=A0A7H0Y257_9BACL|nr:hypothetical protein [Paenibacillus peoriae]QNR65165.1 hypothetical protein IAQ67_14710 [Paenibacillus peoriae]